VEALLRHHPERIRVLWVSPNRDDGRLRRLLERARAQGLAVQPASPQRLARWAEGVAHQGVVAETVPAPTLDERALPALVQGAGPHPLILALDQVEDPRNLGACLRSADAAGVAAVVVPRHGTATLGPAARKTASGAVETVPLVRATNLVRTLGELKALGLWVYGAAGEADLSLDQTDLAGGLVWVVGGEGRGLRRLVRAACDALVAIPMQGSVASLNLSVATGILLFETRRQQRQRAGD